MAGTHTKEDGRAGGRRGGCMAGGRRRGRGQLARSQEGACLEGRNVGPVTTMYG